MPRPPDPERTIGRNIDAWGRYVTAMGLHARSREPRDRKLWADEARRYLDAWFDECDLYARSIGLTAWTS